MDIFGGPLFSLPRLLSAIGDKETQRAKENQRRTFTRKKITLVAE